MLKTTKTAVVTNVAKTSPVLGVSIKPAARTTPNWGTNEASGWRNAVMIAEGGRLLLIGKRER